jgi:outer membrane immunogenic protein
MTLGGAPVPPGLQHNISRDIDWLATLRARLGYSWDRTLAYVTGGFAWGKVNYGAQSSMATFGWDAADFSETQTGWTLGGGLEWAFASNWSAKLEYLYYDLEGASAVTSGTAFAAIHSWDDTKISVVRAGVNYRFGDSAGSAYAADLSRGGVYKAAPAAAYNWTGLYVGGHAGYGWSDATGTTSSAGPASLFDTATFSHDGSGVVAGAQIGYNWQVAPNWVAGVEADMSGTGIGERAYGPLTAAGVPTAGFQHYIGQDIDWLATLRGRVGYSWDRTLAYVTGGFAWGKINYTAQASRNPVGFQAADFSSTQSGWTLGAGLEWAFASNWTAKLEYLYYDLEGASMTIPGDLGFSAIHNWDDTKISAVRVGVNYKFGGPVLAKY